MPVYSLVFLLPALLSAARTRIATLSGTELDDADDADDADDVLTTHLLLASFSDYADSESGERTVTPSIGPSIAPSLTLLVTHSPTNSESSTGSHHRSCSPTSHTTLTPRSKRLPSLPTTNNNNTNNTAAAATNKKNQPHRSGRRKHAASGKKRRKKRNRRSTASSSSFPNFESMMVRLY